MKIHRSLLWAALLLCGAGLPQLRATALYTAGHGDVGVSYTEGSTSFDVHWGIDAGATVNGETVTAHTEYAPGSLAAYTTATATTSSNSAGWLGVTGGSTVFRLGSDAYPPNLGFNTSGAGSDAEWQDSTLTLTLSGWSGPGEVALRSGTSNGAQTWFSTYDEASTVNGDNTWQIDMGAGHIHLVWYFSVPGNYELTFSWSGTYIGGESPVDVTGSGTFGVQVVPEPSTWALAGAGLLALAAARRRMKKRE